MERSSIPSSSKRAINVDDDDDDDYDYDYDYDYNVGIAFGSLSINDHRTVSPRAASSSSVAPRAASSSSVAPPCAEVSQGKSPEDQSQKTTNPATAKKATRSMSSLATPFPDLPSSQELLNAITDWPATSVNPRTNIWASSNYNVGTSTPQNAFGLNYVPPGNFNEGVNSFQQYPFASPMYGNSGLNNYPSGLQSFGASNNAGFFTPLVFDYRNLAPAPFPGFDFFAMATSPVFSEELRRILQTGGFVIETLIGVLPSIIQLMTDQNGFRVFETLLDRREIGDLQLQAIVQMLMVERESFLSAAFCENGSRSIQRLIRKLKNTGLESTVTSALYRFAGELMTHKIASHVVRQCFLVLGEEPNRVLHNFVSDYFLPLAMDPMGCISVNECIDGITGHRRIRLLLLVAKFASPLSYDPSGNFVVQHVLRLQIHLITQKICIALRGQYVQLAQKKGGSHVVEKCLDSDFGRTIAVDEMLKNEKTLVMLAKDQFGNYVVQTALKNTMMYDIETYKRLVQVLEPKNSKIVQKAIESCMKDKIKGGGGGDRPL